MSQNPDTPTPSAAELQEMYSAPAAGAEQAPSEAVDEAQDQAEVNEVLQATDDRLTSALGAAAASGLIERDGRQWKVTKLPTAGESQQRPFEGHQSRRVAHNSGVTNHSLAGTHVRTVTGYKDDRHYPG